MDEDDLSILFEEGRTYSLMTLTGEFTHDKAALVRGPIIEWIDKCLAKNKLPLLVIDVSGLTYLDQTGMGVMMGAQKRLKPARGGLAIINTEPKIQKIFKITGLDKIFQIYESVEDVTFI